MAEIITLDITGMTREQAIEEFMRFYNISQREAGFFVAIELGEIEGDMVLVDSEDNEDSVYSSLD